MIEFNAVAAAIRIDGLQGAGGAIGPAALLSGETGGAVRRDQRVDEIPGSFVGELGGYADDIGDFV